MNKLIANFCLDNDEAIVIRQSLSGSFIGIKLPSRSSYVWTRKDEFEALKESLAMMYYRENKIETPKKLEES